jgi:hypothetical protein
MNRFLRSRPFPWAWLGLVLLGLAGCASGRYVIVEAPTVPLKNFSILEVQDCTSNDKQPDAVKLAGGFADQLVAKLTEYNNDHKNGRLFTSVTKSTDQTDGVLQIQSVLLSYEKGSQALRYIIGFGAGKAYCTVQCTFLDKHTGKQVLKANFEGELSMGLFGGSSGQAKGKVLDAILDYLKKNY